MSVKKEGKFNDLVYISSKQFLRAIIKEILFVSRFQPLISKMGERNVLEKSNGKATLHLVQSRLASTSLIYKV